MQLLELGTTLTLVLLLAFFGVTFLISLSISRKHENADSYMNAGNNVGIGVIAGLMIFGFFGVRAGVALAVMVITLPFAIGFLHLYPVLTASLLAYAVSTILCVALSWFNKVEFDFDQIARHASQFDTRNT